MRFRANENFPVPSIRRLRAAHHDVAAISEDAPGITDIAVLARAVRDERFLLTFDRDHGELIYQRGFSSPIGVLYFRFEPRTPTEPADRSLALLQESSPFRTEHFIVIE